mgnify:CR=1 FL=1
MLVGKGQKLLQTRFQPLGIVFPYQVLHEDANAIETGPLGQR